MMVAGERGEWSAAPKDSAGGGSRRAPDDNRQPATKAVRRKTTVASLQADAGRCGAPSRGRPAARADAPAVAHCADLDQLRVLDPDRARRHVDDYLRAVMSADEADDFEALRYRWELHLVELDQLQLVRTVDLNKRKLAHYRAVLRKDGAFPPLIGLGGDGRIITHDVLLLDGYHRALAMRDVGLCFAWMWLAVDTWKPAVQAVPVASARRA